MQLMWLRVFAVDQQDALILAHNEGNRSLQNRYSWMTGFDVGLYPGRLLSGTVVSTSHLPGRITNESAMMWLL